MGDVQPGEPAVAGGGDQGPEVRARQGVGVEELITVLEAEGLAFGLMHRGGEGELDAAPDQARPGQSLAAEGACAHAMAPSLARPRATWTSRCRARTSTARL